MKGELVATILLICLWLLVAVFALGIEVGKASTLQSHPGYEPAKKDPPST